MGTMRGMKYYSQYGQDKMVLEILRYKKDGFFVDIGANDGITFSNTKCMEDFGWGGVCAEPDCDVFKKLNNNRKSININAAVGNRNGKAKFTKIVGRAQMLSGLSDQYSEEHYNRMKKEVRENGDSVEEVEVRIVTFDELMKDIPDTKIIDFVSIDTEGSELTVLESIDFKKWNISVLAVEDNYCDNQIRDYMRMQGYNVRECKYDNIFIKSTLKNVKKQTFLSRVRHINWNRIRYKLK